MPELVEQMYCSQQIVIPPKFPYILKRYCKAAIKTQPYDLLRWSFEYFKALSEHRPPPVKLRLEYPVYSTEGGLTRGCLKVMTQQLSPNPDLPLCMVRAAWRGFCLDPQELRRILCLCEVYLRQETVPFLHFVAVASGFLTKCLTHTMILVCESLTKEPDGGSAAIPVNDFLTMYKFLAKIDASKDVKYFNGYREGETPAPESVEEEAEEECVQEMEEDTHSDDFWIEQGVHKVTLIDAHVGRTSRISHRLNMPILGEIERSPSIERENKIDWENYQMERRGGHDRPGNDVRSGLFWAGRARPSEEIDQKLREMSSLRMPPSDKEEATREERDEKEPEKVEIHVFDEDNKELPLTYYGEPYYDEDMKTSLTGPEQENLVEEKERVTELLTQLFEARKERFDNLVETFNEISNLVDKFKSANYDLDMVAGRQMSSTSGEFVVQRIEREIMDYIDDQIAILPDPDLKKKKAKPEEVAMIRDILETFLDENMDVIVPDTLGVEEEEPPIPEIVQVYAVPGIGGVVDDEMIKDFEEYALDVCKLQADLFMPRNIRHFLCPPLEKYEEIKYEKNDEEVPAAGAIIV